MTFARFEPAAPIDPDTLAWLASEPAFPRELVDVWQRYGTGFVGDGFLRIIDPSVYGPHMETWFADADDAVPFAATGMGDLLVWQPAGVRRVMYRYGDITTIPEPLGQILAAFEHPQFVQWMRPGQYAEAVQRFGRPGIDDAFAYAPYLVLGGPEQVDHLDPGNLAVTLTIFTQMVGRASIIPGKTP